MNEQNYFIFNKKNDNEKTREENNEVISKLMQAGTINPEAQKHILAGEYDKVVALFPEIVLNENQINIFEGARARNEAGTFDGFCKSLINPADLTPTKP